MRLAVVAIFGLALGITSAAMAQGWRPFAFGFGAGGGTITPAVPCTNQLVFDYSNSCALIGQGWGE